jgi:FKBP-type peptidyl-prolyl cis-trans isomerase FkpA
MSAVTAVPLPPLTKGAVLKLWIALAVLVLAGAGLAWVGTGGMQRTTTKSGVQVRVVDAGRGDPVTRADLFALRLEVRVGGPTGQLLSDPSQSQPAVASMDSLPPGLSEGLQSMREGGHYQLWVPQRLALPNGPPPGAPFGADDKLFFNVNVLQIERGMAALQSLMGQQGQGGGPQGPGGAPHGPGGPGGGPMGPGGGPPGPGGGPQGMPAPQPEGGPTPPPAGNGQ